MKPLITVKERKDQLYKNLVLVSLLSVGVSLLANSLSNKFNSNNLLLWIGLTLIGIVVIAYLISFYKNKEYVITEESLFITTKDGAFMPIERFNISREMGKVLVSVFNENSIYKEKWLNAFKEKHIKDIKESIVYNKEIKKFVGELVEYIFLHKLSLEQSSFFNGKEEGVEVLTRERISDYLLQNRFLEMISKPYSDREAFAKHQDNNNEGTICAMFSGGVIYDRFELKLPKGTSLHKNKNGVLVIKNNNYTIYFKHGFDGFATNLPVSFERYYLKKDFQDISVHLFKPEIKIKLNPIFFLFSRNWKKMNWIDVICEEFSDYFSFDRFIEKIGYEYALTNITVAKNYSNFNNNKSKTTTEPDHIVKPQEAIKEIT